MSHISRHAQYQQVRYDMDRAARLLDEMLNFRQDYQFLVWQNAATDSAEYADYRPRYYYTRVVLHPSESRTYCETHNVEHHEDELYWKCDFDGEINCSSAMHAMLTSPDNKHCAAQEEAHLRWATPQEEVIIQRRLAK